MQELIDFLKSEPIYLGGFAILALLIVGAIAKKMVKLGVIGIVLALGYTYYVHDLAQDAWYHARGLAKDVAGSVDSTADKVKEAGKKALDAVK